jgi:hypothetical protein
VSRSSFRRHLNFANVASALALFIAVSGGTAVALKGVNGVNSGDIKNGSVKTKDLGKNAANGAKVNESTLGIVPLAANAEDAELLDGISSESFQIGNGISGAIAGGVPDNAQTGRIDLGSATLEMECNLPNLVVNVQDDAGGVSPTPAAPTDVWFDGLHEQLTADGASTGQHTYDITADPGITKTLQLWTADGVISDAHISAAEDLAPTPDLCQVVLPIQQNFDGGSPVNSAARDDAELFDGTATGLVPRG